MNIQARAFEDLLGISRDQLIPRAPLQQGVEVFWFVPVSGRPNATNGLFRRSMRLNSGLLQYQNTPVTGIPNHFTMLQLTDIRASANSQIEFRVQNNGRFFVSINQPVMVDRTILNTASIDRWGIFASTKSGVNDSKLCTILNQSTPNVTKVFYESSNGRSSQLFTLGRRSCKKRNEAFSPFPTSQLSITCETLAPFITFEVDPVIKRFQELRNPVLFDQFVGNSGLEEHLRNEETLMVPGRKGFVRMNSASSFINMRNISYEAWRTMTLAIRIQSLSAITDTVLLTFLSNDYFYRIVAKKKDTRIQLIIEHNFTRNPSAGAVRQQTAYELDINKWYLLMIRRDGSIFQLSCDPIDTLVQMNGDVMSTTTTDGGVSIYNSVNLRSFNPSQPFGKRCNIIVGKNNLDFGITNPSSCLFDLAWAHFFEYSIQRNEIFREASANWRYTAFPTTPGNYQVQVPQ
jgi:hypothetical protein